MSIPCRILAIFSFAFLVWGQSISSPAPKSESSSRRVRDVARPASGNAATSKVAPQVYKAASTQEVVPLLILLKSHPQHAIVERIEGKYSLRRHVSERRYQDVAKRAWLTGEDIGGASKELDEITVTSRNEAFEEIRQAIAPDLDRMEAKLKGLGATVIFRYALITMLRADVPSAAIPILEADPDILEVNLVERESAQIYRSVPATGAPTFWGNGFSGSGQKVAVLDSGVRTSHPTLVGRVESYYGIVDNATCSDVHGSAEDFGGHGTHVAGIVGSAGVALTYPQYRGIVPSSSIVNVKVLCKNGGTNADTVNGVELALKVGLPTLNLSLGHELFPFADDDTSSLKLDYLLDLYPATAVLSAGNLPASAFRCSVGSPAVAYNSIAVANAREIVPFSGVFNSISSGSCSGPTLFGRKKPDIAAPGTQIFSSNNNFDGFFGNTFPGHPPYQQFVSMDGTSMAAPHVAGAAALLRQRGVTDPKVVKAILINTTSTRGWQFDRGWGYLNLAQSWQQSSPGDYALSSTTSRSGIAPFRLFRGQSTLPVSATLVWNRHCATPSDCKLNNLDLAVYARPTGILVNSSQSPIDSVEQVFTQTVGGLVVKVHSAQNQFWFGRLQEQFAVAFSTTGFVAASGPQLEVNCLGPGNVRLGIELTVQCVATNNGDLEALNVAGTLNWEGGTGGSLQQFGTLAPGASVSKYWTVTATAVGSYTLVSAIDSASFGEVFRATGTFRFNSSATGTIPGPTTAGGLRFVSLPPCRIMETRPEYNFPTRTGTFGPPFMNAGETRTLSVPNSNVCSIPTTAKAYVLNVTLVPRGGVDFVTVWPGGEARPNFWTVRSPDGLIVANAALVKLGAGGTIEVYASHNTDLIIDISGYFTDYSPQVTNLVFYPMTPCRVIDTRLLYRPQPGPFGPPSMEAQSSRRFKFPDTPYCNVPAGAAAYSFTLTAVPQGILPFMTAWPSDQGRPNVSSINSPAGRILANSVILPASPDGSIDVYAYNKSDFLVDINGYFAADDGTNGQYYYPVTQCRVSDSTTALPVPYGGPMYAAMVARTIPIPTSGCVGIPANAKGFALNVTALPGGLSLPFITAYPAGQWPNTSILNAFEGQVVTNSAIIPSGSNGAANVLAYEKTHVVVEVSGFFGR
ncbi:MAG: S8 family serine peptidase [Bryobacteraceae bacterium]